MWQSLHLFVSLLWVPFLLLLIFDGNSVFSRHMKAFTFVFVNLRHWAAIYLLLCQNEFPIKYMFPSGACVFARFHGRVENNRTSISVGCFHITGFWHGITTYTKYFMGFEGGSQEIQSAYKYLKPTFCVNLKSNGRQICLHVIICTLLIFSSGEITLIYTGTNPHVQRKRLIYFVIMFCWENSVWVGKKKLERCHIWSYCDWQVILNHWATMFHLSPLRTTNVSQIKTP